MEENNKDFLLIKKIYSNKKIIIYGIIIVLLVFIFNFLLLAPNGSKDEIIHIPNGKSVDSISLELEQKKVVKSDFILKLFIRVMKSDRGIISGDYLIKKNSPVFLVSWQIARGHHNIEPIRVTIKEGLKNEDIASLLTNKFVDFNKNLFLTQVEGKQGYLFPDTYFLYPLDTVEEIINKLSTNFENRIKNVKPLIVSNGKNLPEIITMASILQGEASGISDIYIISGILWKRISLGMPLQVDVAKSTYDTKGLPSNPINNPGLLAIKAAIEPLDSSYLYYLHDKNGKVHYAVTYEEHKRNIDNYLR